MVKFELFVTPENIELARTFKTNQNRNVITLAGNGGFTRTFNNCSLNADYEVNPQSEGTMELEFMGDPSI